jgi:hypothetical protein
MLHIQERLKKLVCKTVLTVVGTWCFFSFSWQVATMDTLLGQPRIAYRQKRKYLPFGWVVDA